MVKAFLQERVIFDHQWHLCQRVKHHKDKQAKEEEEVAQLHPAYTGPVVTHSARHHAHDDVEIVSHKNDCAHEHEEKEVALAVAAHEHDHRQGEVHEEHGPHQGLVALPACLVIKHLFRDI